MSQSEDPRPRREFLEASVALAGAAALLAPADALCAQASTISTSTRGASDVFAPLPLPAWVNEVTRMGYLTPDQADEAARIGVQVVHTNVVWPYFPLRKDGGGLAKQDAANLRALVAACRERTMKVVLGLPPFPSVAHLEKHPTWRVHPDNTDAAAKVAPREDNLGTRLGCNLGPWGEYLIELCGELVADYRVAGFSFDGNYHPPLCFCPACKEAYRAERARDLPPRVDLADVAYREYLVWRGERLAGHYRRMQVKLKSIDPDAVIMSWTVNAGRYGHFLHSPRAMPTRLNLLFDLPMQEWWLDETNQGASLLPAFGAAYLRGTVGDRPAAAEPYLMARGNPYGTDSFPAHERLTRARLALTYGNILAMSLGWPGHNVAADFALVKQVEAYLSRTRPLAWAACLVSEQTRQFYAWQDIAERFLPYPQGVFRAATEEHLPLWLINDWDVTAEALAPYAVVVLPNVAALSMAQADALRAYVRQGGGLVVTGETSLCDELGRPRRDFALADLLGVSFLGRPAAPSERPPLDENFARSLDESYWKQRVGVVRLSWEDHPLVRDETLQRLVPGRSVACRAPLVKVSEPANAAEVVARMRTEGHNESAPAIIARQVERGRVVYLPAAIDAALWSYPYPYQRVLLAQALRWAAKRPAPISVKAPLCVQVTHFRQTLPTGKERLVIHLFNGLDTAANHSLPGSHVPLREEIVPIHGIEVNFHADAPTRLFLEPGHQAVTLRREAAYTTATLPPLETHAILVGE